MNPNLPELLSTAAKGIVENANRLGLTWRLSIGTVTEASSANRFLVILDGDENEISVTSMMGTVTVGRRVYVVSVPPSGNYALGMVSGLFPGTRIATSERTSDVSTFTAETVTDTVTGDLIEAYTYRIVGFITARSTVVNDVDLIRIREDGLGGTIMRNFRIVIPQIGAGTDFFAYTETQYVPAANETKTFVLTGARASGSGSITHTAGPTNPAYLYIDFVQDF
jgi:hypothetical protein